MEFRAFLVSVKALNIFSCAVKPEVVWKVKNPLEGCAWYVMEYRNARILLFRQRITTYWLRSNIPQTLLRYSVGKLYIFRPKFLSKKVKFALEQARKAQTGSKGLALLFLYHRRERSRPRPGRFTPGKRSLLLKIQKTQEAKFVPGNAIKSYRVNRQVVVRGQFYSGKETGAPWIGGGWMGLGASLGVPEKRKFVFPCQDSKTRSSSS